MKYSIKNIALRTCAVVPEAHKYCKVPHPVSGDDTIIYSAFSFSSKEKQSKIILTFSRSTGFSGSDLSSTIIDSIGADAILQSTPSRWVSITDHLVYWCHVNDEKWQHDRPARDIPTNTHRTIITTPSRRTLVLIWRVSKHQSVTKLPTIQRTVFSCTYKTTYTYVSIASGWKSGMSITS